jgi:hypothetical protein
VQTADSMELRVRQFHKRGQLFIGAHDETLSVAMRVHNPDCSSFKVES